jgi:DNA repair protein RadA/Sms
LNEAVGVSGVVQRLRPSFRAVAAQPLDRVGDGSGQRRLSGIDELDRVLGGGVVAGSLILLGGDPGIGKSTLAQCTR